MDRGSSANIELDNYVVVHDRGPDVVLSIEHSGGKQHHEVPLDALRVGRQLRTRYDRAVDGKHNFRGGGGAVDPTRHDPKRQMDIGGPAQFVQLVDLDRDLVAAREIVEGAADHGAGIERLVQRGQGIVRIA